MVTVGVHDQRHVSPVDRRRRHDSGSGSVWALDRVSGRGPRGGPDGTPPGRPRRADPIPLAERTRSPRRANPIPGPSEPERPPFVRLRAAPCVRVAWPSEPGASRRADPSPGAERTRASASGSPRCVSVRDGAGVRGLEPPATKLPRSTRYHREWAARRSPNPRRGAGPLPRPGRPGAGISGLKLTHDRDSGGLDGPGHGERRRLHRARERPLHDRERPVEHRSLGSPTTTDSVNLAAAVRGGLD